MIHVGICDDDELYTEIIAERLNVYFKEYTNQKIKIHIYLNGQACIEGVLQEKIDLLFLDIQMPTMSGKQVAKQIRKFDKNLTLVFLTALRGEMLNTYEYRVYDYLPKELMEERLPKTLARFVTDYEEEQVLKEIFWVDTNSQILCINKKEIIYFESNSKKIFLVHSRGKCRIYRVKFEELREKYKEKGFIDIHRTCVINPKYIYQVGDQEVILDNGEHLPLSRRKREQAMKELTRLIVGETL